MSRFPAKTRVTDCLRLVVAENVILRRFRAVSPRWTFLCEIWLNKSLTNRNARFRLGSTYSRRKYYFEAIPSYEAEIDIHVRFWLMSRFPADTRVNDWLLLVVAENVILERFRPIKPRSTFHFRFC